MLFLNCNTSKVSGSELELNSGTNMLGVSIWKCRYALEFDWIIFMSIFSVAVEGEARLKVKFVCFSNSGLVLYLRSKVLLLDQIGVPTLCPYFWFMYCQNFCWLCSLSHTSNLIGAFGVKRGNNYLLLFKRASSESAVWLNTFLRISTIRLGSS